MRGAPFGKTKQGRGFSTALWNMIDFDSASSATVSGGHTGEIVSGLSTDQPGTAGRPHRTGGADRGKNHHQIPLPRDGGDFIGYDNPLKVT